MSSANPRNWTVLVVTPAKDEGRYIRKTILAMAAQTHRPALWVIVDDGSSDDTGAIADAAAEEHPWIRVVHRRPGPRRVGPGVIEAFYAGLDTVDLEDFDFVCKFDGDVEIQPHYFEKVLERFAENPRLGTASGKAYTPIEPLESGESKLALERIRDDISVGLAKLYRRECFEDIGGFVREVMWDGIDNHRCRMSGWEAASFGDPDLALVHLRLMGSSHKGIFHGRRRWGFGQYYMGTHPLYLAAISVYRMAERPWILGGLCIAWGYLGSKLRGLPRYEDLNFRRHLRRWQMHELRHFLKTRRQCTAPSTLIYRAPAFERAPDLEKAPAGSSEVAAPVEAPPEEVEARV